MNLNDDWTRERRYRSDDLDLEDGDNDLVIFHGGNGDWYMKITRHGERMGPAVRLTTSGTRRGFHGVPAAVARLFRALPPESEEPRAADALDVEEPLREALESCLRALQPLGSGHRLRVLRAVEAFYEIRRS